jgi:hypothetical protein
MKRTDYSKTTRKISTTELRNLSNIELDQLWARYGVLGVALVTREQRLTYVRTALKAAGKLA